MTLSYVGWINAFSAMSIVISNCIVGLFFIYKSRKLNARLLFYAGLMIFFTGLIFISRVFDFLTIVLTGKNMDNRFGISGILTFIWIAPTLILGMYIGAELIIPEKKWIIVFFYIVLTLIFELFIILDTFNMMTFTYPENSGEDLIDISMVRGSPAYFLLVIFLISLIIFNGFGFLIKSIQSTGVLRKKFLMLSMGFFLFVVCATLEAYAPSGVGVVLARFGLICTPWFMYFGLKEERAKPTKLSIKKKVIFEETQPTLIETLLVVKPTQITEEEVSFYREKLICLVCKDKVGGFNKFIFICIKCKALYCENCARTLSDLENACWVCNEPIDESKPSTPFKKDEEIELETSEKPQKKPKVNKKS